MKPAAVALLWSGCALVLDVTPAFADSQCRIVRLSNVEGTVQVTATGKGSKTHSSICDGRSMKLRPKTMGARKLEFEDGARCGLPQEQHGITSLAYAIQVAGFHPDSADRAGLRQLPGQAEGRRIHAGLQYETVPLTRPVHFRLDVDPSDACCPCSRGPRSTECIGSVNLSKNNSATFDLLGGDKYTSRRTSKKILTMPGTRQQVKYQQEYASKGRTATIPMVTASAT